MSSSERDIIRGLQERVDELEITIRSKESGFRLRTVELRRMEVERYRAEFNYASVCLTRAKDRLRSAERESRG